LLLVAAFDTEASDRDADAEGEGEVSAIVDWLAVREIDAGMLLDVVSDTLGDALALERVSETGTDKVAATEEVWLVEEEAESTTTELDPEDPQLP
jgi:hypothetical protein